MSNLLLPNLPQSPVTHIIMGNNCKAFETLKSRGISITDTVSINKLPIYERTHADMQVLPLDKDTVFLLRESEQLLPVLEEHYDNVIMCKDELIRTYPFNTALNCAIVKNNIFCRIDFVYDEFLWLAEDYGFNMIDTQNGYAKCSTAVVTENAIITDSKDIGKKAREENAVDVLEIPYGGVRLLNTNRGYIGGCCFKLSKDILAFTGQIKNHPKYEEIKSFCLSHGVFIEELSDEEMPVDIGGAVIIDTKK